MFNGFATLMDYCTGPSFAVGGFIADSAFDGSTVVDSRRQSVVRNSTLDGWTNGVWNQVFSRVSSAHPPSASRLSRRAAARSRRSRPAR